MFLSHEVQFWGRFSILVTMVMTSGHTWPGQDYAKMFELYVVFKFIKIHAFRTIESNFHDQ